MQEAIAVPVNGREPTEQILPVIESFARPGMRVVLLVRSRTDGWDRLSAQLTVINTGNMIALQNCALRRRAVLEQEKRSADARLEKLCKSLRNRSLETEVRLYTGRVTTILANIVQNENVRFVLMPARGVHRLGRLVRAIVQFLNPVKPPVFWPLVLIHREAAVPRSR